MAGVTGSETKAAYALCNTWGVPASVTTGCLLQSTSGLDGLPQMIDDDAFNQRFQGDAERGDYNPNTPDLETQLRYDDFVPVWMAMAIGSPAAPTVVSSVAANSLVAYQHVITLADELTKYMTLAIDVKQYVKEITSVKLRGFTVRTGENGRMMIAFPAVGNKAIYNSTVNTNSTLADATAAALGNKVMRRHGVFRMNLQGAGALAASDANSIIREIAIGTARPMAQDDHVVGSDAIIEPDDDGWPEFPVELTFARMNTVSANSLAIGLAAADKWKGDLTFTSHLYINSTTQYSMKFEWPNLQLYSFEAPVVGRGQVRPKAMFRAKLATSSPTGMAFVNPVQVTLVNANSATLN